jgi:SAM-dependent methyltransferase
MSAETTCWACGSGELTPIFAVEDLALSSLILVATREEAIAFPRGNVELVVCRTCGFIYNGAFRPELVDYTMPYESSQIFSPRFRSFAEELVEHLVTDYSLMGKSILEIGCGDGSFLEVLCRRAGARGVGIDPAFDPSRIGEDVDVTAIPGFYDETTTDLTADLICCRHTLEHIQPVRRFVELTRISATRTAGAVVFFEVPDTDRILEEGAFWDVYNEHCSYFTLTSLAYLFESTGFEILRLTKGFDDQYLLIDAQVTDRRGRHNEESVANLLSRAERFRDAAQEAVIGWRAVIDAAADRGETVVLWGASSKAVAFLASVGRDDQIAAAVDINPFKQDKFLPGSGVAVIGPEQLPELKPQLVVIMNPIYRDEIGDTLAELGLDPRLVALGDELGGTAG